MIAATTPCKGEPGSRPSCPPQPGSRPKLASLASIPGVYWNTVPRRPLPHIEHGQGASGHKAPPARPFLAERLQALPPDHQLRSFLDDIEAAGDAQSAVGPEFGDCEAFAAGLPLEPGANGSVPQAHVRALVHDFRRRQRWASIVVAGCIAASFVLTFAGIATLAGFTKPEATGALTAPDKSTPTDWEGPPAAKVRFIFAASAPEIAPNDPPAAPAAAGAVETPRLAAPQLILMTSNRPLALAPLLSLRQARYVLVRGLPKEATLSAGQRNPSGAWLVKEKDVSQLTLSVGANASGDYPVEIYALGATSAPQARQRLLIRVAQALGAAAVSDASPPLAMASTAPDEAEVMAADSSPLMALAMRLLEEGDIAAARRLFLHLADQGEGDAAYELARTFDTQALTRLGAKGLSADRASAVTWYERASKSGNVKAAERLKILASLSD